MLTLFSVIILKCNRNIVQPSLQWNELCKKIFRLCLSGIDITDCPSIQLVDSHLTLTFQSPAQFNSFVRIISRLPSNGDQLEFGFTQITSREIHCPALRNDTEALTPDEKEELLQMMQSLFQFHSG